MRLHHTVQINVARPDTRANEIIQGTTRRIPTRLLKFLFGDATEVLLLSPGSSIESVEIREMKGGSHNADRCTADAH